nr:glycosyltransferase family 2 protein [Schwartzia sp. (in: firmicutes)]
MKVTACVIVKNEEKNIESWLESARRLADQIIVVDTGSEDKTKALAAEGGAELFDFPWCNDFSAAKNYALEQADGDWIVFLDADETIRENDAPKAREAMERYLKDMRVMGFVCRLVDYDQKEPEVEKDDCYQIRIFRNSRSIRYEGRIHEHLVDAS